MMQSAFRSVDIVLVEPEIPPNTGNIGRVCVGLGLKLVLAGKLGFELDDTKLKRAGLDYWPNLNLEIEPDLGHLRTKLSKQRPVLFTTKASQSVFDVDLCQASALVFGCETRGLPNDWHQMNNALRVGFPQSSGVRSYNLANVVFGAAMLWAQQTGWQPVDPE